jgi:transcriptional regulator with XRE-family HTH domain
MTFGEILKEMRTQTRITQEQFAHELSVSFSTISRWENGHTSPSRLAKMRLIEFSKKNNIDTSTRAELEKL